MINIKAILGVEGVNANENETAVRIGRYFSYAVLVALLVVAVQLVLDYSDEDKDSIWISVVVWLVFTTELVVNLHLVNDKKLYLKNNWLNVLIVILVFPWIDYGGDWAAIFRALRLLLFLRVALDGYWDVVMLLKRNNFGIVLMVAFVFIIISGALFAVIEKTDFASGVWYALVTVTTVGYGDMVPQSDRGRLFGAVLILFGVVLFSLVTANISAFLIGAEQKNREKEILKAVFEMQQSIESQSKKNEYHIEQVIGEVNRKVDELEHKMQIEHSNRLEHGISALEGKLKAENQQVLKEIKELVRKL